MVKQQVDHGQTRIPLSKWVHTQTDVHIPILMYHDINTGNSLQMPEQQLNNQMHWLKDAGYYFLSPKEAYIALTQNKLPQKKVVWVTFDDGYKSMFTKGLPIFKAVGAYVTINLITSTLNDPQKCPLQINKAQMDKMVAATRTTVSMESHTVSHLDMNTMPLAQQQKEMADSRTELRQLLHQPILTVAYPAGHYDADSVTAAKEAGYKMALTTTPGLATASQGLLQLHRVRINPGLDKDQYLELVKTGY
ncbi:polysaccharide deacetylase [Lactobacillus selangorensis]|uniref:Polysaccharide deacetylase n=1 Tax=Lactobacillus selangorensis TaxID=81857 RepID=A0A0R2FRD6_9LACO|nr:polysaccharide deacetylase [Lactobacillus selangorensis]KRN30912.1 polysaccharide deacetylase [Lactobacillus selangorensis]